jgi:hypothetical protein
MVSCATTAVGRARSWADVVVACVGEKPYAEKPGDIDDAALAPGYQAFLRDLSHRGRTGPRGDRVV